MIPVFKNPVQSIFTDSYIDTLTKLLTDSKNVLVVTSKIHTTNKNISSLINDNKSLNFYIVSDVLPNPEVSQIQSFIDGYKGKEIDTIIAIGGGSVIDTAKVVSYFLNEAVNISLKEHIENNKEFVANKINLFAIPTTSGTGAEVTPFATVWEKNFLAKHSFTSNEIYPDYAIYDANITLSMPYDLTLYTSLDSISHALESLWNKNSSVSSSVYSISSLRLSLEYLPKLLDDIENLKLRHKIQLASHLSGLAISNTRTALAHSASYPLTYRYDVPHGLACSFMLSDMINDNIDELTERYDEYILFKNISKLLESLNLKTKLLNYLEAKQLSELINEMCSNPRASNYIFDANEEKIKSYIFRGI